jgi:hypothetical protein
MAAPRLRLRRGTSTPVGNVTTALSGEPFFDTSASNLYVASGASTFVHVGGTSYTARVDESLTAATATTSGEVTILARTDGSGGGSVTFDVADIASDSTYTWPAAPASAKILQTDSSGNLSWVDQTSGYSGWTVSDGTNSENIASTDTVTFTGGSGISQSYNTTSNVLTTALDINELTALDAEGGADPLVVADSIAVYDASATGNKKVTISNLETVIFADIGGDIAVAANGTATIQNNSVALGTKTTGNYVEDVTAGAGLAKTSSASEGQTVDLAVGAGEGITVNADDVALNITGLTADTIADADELAFYDTVDAVNGVGHNKITAGNLALYVLQEATGDVTFNASGVAQIANNSVDLGTHTTGDYVATVSVTANGGISTSGASTGEGTTHALALDIDGMTDIGAALTDADLIAVDDGGAGTNRKAAVTRISDYTFGKVSGDITIAANGTAAIGSGVIVDGDISATAEIAVSKLANGTARQLLQTDAAGTGVEWASNIDVPGTLDVTGDGTFDSNVTITGNLTVNGTTTTLSTTNTVIEDRLLELANGTTGTPTADAGIVIERGDLDNIFIGYDEGLDIFVTGTTTAVGTATDVSPTPIAVLCGALHVTDTAGTNEAIVSYLAAGSAPDGATAGRYLQNLTIDAGTY